MTKKPHIKSILKKGAKLKARKLTEEDRGLIDKTLEEQKRILELLNIPYEVYNQRITI